jgi:hypothetical protein
MDAFGGVSSAMGSVQAGSQNDVFYDLLSNSTSALNGGGQQKKRDLVETRISSPVVDFGNEEVQPPRYDVQPSYDFQPSASALGNSKITAFSSGNLSSSLVCYYYTDAETISILLLKP